MITLMLLCFIFGNYVIFFLLSLTAFIAFITIIPIMKNCKNIPGWNITALLHEGTQREPETVEDAEFIGVLRWFVLLVLLAGALAMLPLWLRLSSFWRRRPVLALLLTTVLWVIAVPLVWAEATHQEQDYADADVRKHYTHPDLVGQRIQKGEDSWFGFGGLLDHDWDTQAHEGLGEVNDLLSDQGDGKRSHSYVSFLYSKCKIAFIPF